MFTDSELLEKINDYISKLTYAKNPRGLYEPIEYAMSLGGKRVRPVLMMMAYNLYHDDVDRILSQAAGIILCLQIQQDFNFQGRDPPRFSGHSHSPFACRRTVPNAMRPHRERTHATAKASYPLGSRFAPPSEPERPSARR